VAIDFSQMAAMGPATRPNRAVRETGLARRVDGLLRDAVERLDLPGLAVGVVQDGELAFAAGFGVKCVATGEPVSAATLFQAATVSETCVAAGILQLAEARELSLDTPVAELLPYFSMRDPRHRDIRVRHLLAHSAGLPEMAEFPARDRAADDRALERFVRRLGGETLASAPGERWRWTHTAYAVLGDILAKAGGASFETVVKRRVLGPAGMHHSTFREDEALSCLVAAPHLRAPETVPSPVWSYNRGHAPATCLQSNVLELCNWARVHLSRGRVDGRRLLRPSSFDLLWRAGTAAGGGPADLTPGLGWLLGEVDGEPAAMQTGWDPGFSACLILLPARGVAGVALCNESAAPLRALLVQVFRALRGEKAQLPDAPPALSISRRLAAGGLPAAAEEYGRLCAAGGREGGDGGRGLVLLGLQLLWAGQTETARGLLELVVERHPDCAEGRHALAMACERLGDGERAVALLRRYLEMEPSGGVAARRLLQLTGGGVH